MPKKSGKRRKNFVAIPVSGSITVGALAAGDVIAADLFSTDLLEDLFIISADCEWAIRNQTTSEGTLQVGFAHNDLTAAEIEEHLEIEWVTPDDIIGKERAKRPVRRVGQLNTTTTDVILNDGKPIRTKFKFTVGNGYRVAIWARQNDSGAKTTGSVVTCEGMLYGRWLR